MARVVVLHHLDDTFLGYAGEALRAAGVELDERDLKRGEPLPEPGEADAILSLGGDQSVLDIDRYPYLVAEAELLRAEAERGTPILGVCLGGQLLAHALGGSVERMPVRTVDWSEVRRLPEADGDPVFGGLPPVFRALHWNEDCFQVPDGAVELLSRAGPGGEAFRWGGSAWGIQFHPEADAGILDGWYRDVAWLEEAGIEEAAAREADRLHLPGQPSTAEGIFGGFAAVVSDRAQAQSPASATAGSAATVRRRRSAGRIR
ncbi:MAG: type 1 glutamine amidotransferase [Thermoleophilaceae bacterium]